jgi:hypothetical protein
MHLLPPLLKARLDWCQKMRTQLGLREEEKEAWLAEEEGLRDALIGMEHIPLIRICYPFQVERYQLGFEDGQTLVRASRHPSCYQRQL